MLLETLPYRGRYIAVWWWIYPTHCLVADAWRVWALEWVETRQWGRADANFKYRISWDCGGAAVGIILALGRRSHTPIVRIYRSFLSSSGVAYR
ncbi:hypothetical protein ACNKHM_15640 [Shigella sonnei]